MDVEVASLFFNNEGVNFFVCSLGFTALLLRSASLRQSTNASVSILLPNKACPAIKKGSSFNERVTATINKCTPYNFSMYSHLDYFGHLNTTVQFFLRNVTRVIFHSMWLPSSISNVRSISYDRETLLLDDNSTIAIDWAYIRSCSTSGQKLVDSNFQGEVCTVLICHGICGDSQAEYIIHLVEKLLSASCNPASLRRYEVAVMISRGCGGLALSSCDTFGGHSKLDDIHAAVCAVKDRYPQNKIFLLGFSLGAAFSLKYLAKYNTLTDESNTPSSLSPAENIAMVTAAMCVSPPWDFHKTTPVFPLWNVLLAIPLKLYLLRHFLWPLTFSYSTQTEKSDVSDLFCNRNASEKRSRRNEQFLASVGFWRILMTMSLSQLDELLYPLFDESYRSVKCYYNAMSPVRDAHKINTPTLVVSAIDDPVCCHTGAPNNSEDLGPGLAVVKTKFGGHLGFPEGLLPVKDAWTDRLALEWFSQF